MFHKKIWIIGILFVSLIIFTSCSNSNTSSEYSVSGRVIDSNENAECGVASGMAAAAAIEMLGGSSEMVIHGFAAAHALTAAQMALSGIKSIIPADQVVDALYRTGELMPSSLKETSQAGLADTDTARDIELKLNMCR